MPDSGSPRNRKNRPNRAFLQQLCDLPFYHSSIFVDLQHVSENRVLFASWVCDSRARLIVGGDGGSTVAAELSALLTDVANLVIGQRSRAWPALGLLVSA